MKPYQPLIVLVTLVVTLWSTSAFPQTLAGYASVTDGDTVSIGDTRIRFHGIDAPESDQTCKDAGGQDYRCGDRATEALRQMIGSNPIGCEQRDLDRYGRVVAECYAGSSNLNAAMVTAGHAMAYRMYSSDYVGHEENAKANRVGIWQGAFTPPWVYRQVGNAANDNAPTSNSGDTSCPIKGNISSGGKIYHVPGSRWYGKTVISPEKGERWFCSETEAKQAGWRKAGTSAVTTSPAYGAPKNAVRSCCKYCSKGKPCGNSCISRSKTCHKSGGCAC